VPGGVGQILQDWQGFVETSASSTELTLLQQGFAETGQAVAQTRLIADFTPQDHCPPEVFGGGSTLGQIRRRPEMLGQAFSGFGTGTLSVGHAPPYCRPGA